MLEICELCPERAYTKQPVAGWGDINSPIAIIGYRPGVTENATGLPFAGRAGVFLDKYLATIDLPRSKCWIDNLVKCYAGSGTFPSNQTQSTCTKRYLRPTLLAMPNLQLIVMLGQHVLSYFEPVAALDDVHGSVWPVQYSDNKTVSLFATSHPSIASRSANAEKLFRKDFEQLGKIVKSIFEKE